MTPFISIPEDRARLVAEARSWLETPYAADGAVKGAGCSCALLPWAILSACGHESPRPPARMGLLKTQLIPAIRSWLDAHSEHFARIDPSLIDCGDIVLVYAGIGHAALAINPDTLIHCWASGGVQTVSRNDPSISKRIVGAWRPVRAENVS